MHKMIYLLGSACLLLTQVGATQVRDATPPFQLQRFPPNHVSEDGLILFEDIEALTPEMRGAMRLAQDSQYEEAIRQFRRIQERAPTDPLPFRAEMLCAYENHTLPATVARFKSLLAAAAGTGHREAVLHYSLACALFASRLEKLPWDPPGNVGQEPKEHLDKALRLWPELVVAYFQLATFYDHRSQHNGTEARRCYDKALALRPDLAAKIRYLHARSWSRPGYMKPDDIARLKRNGIDVPVDMRDIPERVIAECKQLIRDFPDFAPPYEQIANEYALMGAKASESHFRTLAAQVRVHQANEGHAR